MEGPVKRPGWLQGLSDHYLGAAFPSPRAWRNRRVMVRFRVIQDELLLGEAVDEA